MVNVPHCKRHNANGCSPNLRCTNQLNTCVSQHRHTSHRLSSAPTVVHHYNFVEKMFRRPVQPTPCQFHSTVLTRMTICVCVHWQTPRCATRWGYRSCHLYCGSDSMRNDVAVVVMLNRLISSSRSTRTGRRCQHQQTMAHFHFSPA